MDEEGKLKELAYDATSASSSGTPTCSRSLDSSSMEGSHLDPLKHPSSSAHCSTSVQSRLSESSASDPLNHPSCDDEASCSFSTSGEDNTLLDVKIKTKISDLNQTFLRIINNLKIMNVHNRNSGRNDLNSNNQVLSLFDDFLNISHLLNIKINYLYNTYVSRSEMKKYVSSINYKLYVFNINSFELSQGIDKDNKKHKKYQILHDLNISEMTNNVKLFNFVDDVAVNPRSSERDKEDQASSSTQNKDVENETGNVKTCEHTEPKIPPCQMPAPSDEDLGTKSANLSHAVEKQYTKRLKRKTECQTLDSEDSHSGARPEDSESTSKVDSNTKKLKTIELNTSEAYSNESVDMFNNLFKEINSNILELSKDIDVLNGYLKMLAPRTVESPMASESAAQENEDNGSSEDEEEELKKQTLADQKLKKWQITQMTRSLIDNMVNSIQEEMMSRRSERHERSLVNEAVLMAIQRHGLQQQEQRDSEADRRLGEESDPSPEARRSRLQPATSHPEDNSCETAPLGALQSRGEPSTATLVDARSKLTDIEPTYSMDVDSSPGSDQATPTRAQCQSRNPDLVKAFDHVNANSTCSDPEDSESSESGSVRIDETDSCEQTGSSRSGPSPDGPCRTGEARKEVLSDPSSSEQYYDENLAGSEDFLSRAVAVAISKKGLST